MGKRIWRRGWVCGEELGDVCESVPIDPDEFGERILSLCGTVFFLSIAESGTSSPAVMGMSRRVATELFEPEGFFGKREGPLGVNPDLEITG